MIAIPNMDKPKDELEQTEREGVKMKNYCRYCGHCIDNGYNDYYCTLKEKFLTTETVKHWACGSYGDCDIDVITGEDRKERKSFRRINKVDDGEQIKIGE